jgi:hypothetical protein
MKRKAFKLMVVGGGGDFFEIVSTDYDEDINLVRHKDVLYDIPTGLWVVTLSRIQKGFDTWKGCGAFPDTTQSSMMSVVKSNGIFKHRLEKQRQKVYDNKLAEIVNKSDVDLFSFM